MNQHNKRPILEVLDTLSGFCPVKICFNDTVLYNDYDSTEEIEPGVVGELEPYMIAVPMRLKTALDKYNIYVDRIDIRIVHYHHSVIYLYGEKHIKE